MNDTKITTGEKMDSFMRTETCCGCFSPRIGILILSLLAIIFSALSFILSAIRAVAADYEPALVFGLSGHVQELLIILSMAINIMHIVTRSLLIIGVQQDKPLLIFPSVCLDFAGIYVLIPMSFLVFVIPDLPLFGAFLIFLIFIMALFLLSHWFFVLYYYYEDLRSKISESLPKSMSDCPGV